MLQGSRPKPARPTHTPKANVDTQSTNIQNTMDNSTFASAVSCCLHFFSPAATLVAAFLAMLKCATENLHHVKPNILCCLPDHPNLHTFDFSLIPSQLLNATTLPQDVQPTAYTIPPAGHTKNTSVIGLAGLVQIFVP